MLRIGCHLPSSKGYLEMGKHAVALGATTFAFFTRNPRGGKAKPIQKEDVAAFLAYAAEHISTSCAATRWVLSRRIQ